MLYIGTDHRGFELKNKIKDYLQMKSLDYQDCGALQLDPDDDFVTFAVAVAQAVAEKPDEHRGILICRNGVGMDIVANRFKNIRCGLAFNEEQIRLARNDDDINVVSFSSEFIKENQVFAILDVFLMTAFEGHERQQRRLQKIDQL